MNPAQFKLVFKGYLEFGNQRTFEMASKHWQTRIENYFKTDILFKAEQVFVPADFVLDVPQQTLMNGEKHWRNTTALLNELSQYAVAGAVMAWRLHNGQVLEALTIEPQSEKVAVTAYKRGCELVRMGGHENEAADALNRAIEKFERHAAAYERRGYVNYKLQNYNDALHDFSKSIDINPANPDPYYGRGKVKMLKNDWDGAVQDFEQAIRRSLALQPIYWLGRLKKGESLLHSKKYKEAAAELNSFLQRGFSENDPNYRRRHRAWFNLGKALLGMQDIDGALSAFQSAKDSLCHADLAPSEACAFDRLGTTDFAATARRSAAEAMRMLE